MNLSYDILIPAFNARQTLPTILASIGKLNVRPNSVIVVDDGSTDNTALTVDQFPFVHLIRLKSNSGKGKALRIGMKQFLKNKNSAFLLMMDADGQHPVDSIPEFIKHINECNCDIVIGNRVRKLGIMPWSRIFSNTVSSLITSWITGIKIPDSQCGFRLLRRTVIESVLLEENGFQIETELIIKAAKQGFSFGFVSVPTIYNGQKSYIKHVNDTIRFLKIILGELVRS